MHALVVLAGVVGVLICATQLATLRRYNLLPAIVASAAFTVQLGSFAYLMELVKFYESVGAMEPAERHLHVAGPHGAPILVTALIAASTIVVLGTIAAQLLKRKYSI